MPPRPRLSLDGQWQFWADPEASLSLASLSARQSSLVTVPAPWQSQASDLRFYTGVAWYRRTVEIPADWSKRCVVLGFGAADYLAEVWCNDVKVGEHEGGYLPFEFDVTGAARPGENAISVRVADPPDLFHEIPHGKQSWYGPLSGLWQPVWLECRPATHLLGARITPDAGRRQVDVEASLNRPLAPDESLTFEVIAPDGQVRARADSQAPAVSLRVTNPLLWDVDSPNLYTLRVTLNSGTGGQPSISDDALTDTFGFRTIAARDGRLLLNGRPLYLRGALDQDYYPDLICTPPSLEYIEDEFRKAKAMGLNCLRVHIKVADPRYYYAADRRGLLIWTELPNWEHLTQAAIRRGRETLEGMVRRDWNHPSLLIWTILNEAWGAEIATNPDHRAWLAEMYDWVKKLDPTRLVVDNSPCFPNFHVRTDIEDFHCYAAMPDGAARWDKWVQDFAHRAAWLYARGDSHVSSPNGEGEGQGDAPLVVSEFGNWGLPDLGPLVEHYHGEPWWFETGWDWGEGSVYPHAAAERFRILHLDKVFGDYAGLARASQWAQFEALKYEIETMRLYPGIAGYVITEFTDVHWECNGLLDMLRRPKAHFSQLADLNADTLIIPRTPRRAYWSGEAVAVDLHISHFGAAPIQDAHLEWSLTGQAAPAIEGFERDISLEPMAVVHLRPLNLTAPGLTAPASARLQLTLLDRANTVIARNDLGLSLFPRPTATSQSLTCLDSSLAQALGRLGFTLVPPGSNTDAPIVFTRLDASARRFVEQGGRALCLAETPESLETAVPRLGLKRRKNTPWAGDWASTFAWYRKDKFAPAIPGDGRLDFTFAAIIPEAVIVSVRSMDFEREVLAGLFVGWLRHPAALIQKIPLGRGTLLVTTLRLKDHLGTDPVATTLFYELLRELE